MGRRLVMSPSPTSVSPFLRDIFPSGHISTVATPGSPGCHCPAPQEELCPREANVGG